MTSQSKLSNLEVFGYYTMCIVTFGGYWFMKVLIKKAIIEATEKGWK